MGCDMVVALGPATVSGHAFLGANHFGSAADQPSICYLPAREHVAGQNVGHPNVVLPQVRVTASVLGLQTPGSWGLVQGCNQHHVAVGMTRWKSRIARAPGELDGPALVRLVLERAQSARHAADVLSELIERHGQSADGMDHVFSMVDRSEAFVVETAGHHWGQFECQHTRAVCDASLIRQDWQRLSRGLAELVFENGWWPDDGTKIDFHASLKSHTEDPSAGRKRWSRATLALAQQEGSIDAFCLRQLLLEHHDHCLGLASATDNWQGSWIAHLVPDMPPLVWVAPAHLGVTLFFPHVVGVGVPQATLEGLPALSRSLSRGDHRTHDLQSRLQSLFDQEAEEYCHRARLALANGKPADAAALGYDMMQRHALCWLDEARGQPPLVASRHANRDDSLEFVSE